MYESYGCSLYNSGQWLTSTAVQGDSSPVEKPIGVPFEHQVFISNYFSAYEWNHTIKWERNQNHSLGCVEG
jgi:hypothetical protein